MCVFILLLLYLEMKIESVCLVYLCRSLVICSSTLNSARQSCRACFEQSTLSSYQGEAAAECSVDCRLHRVETVVSPAGQLEAEAPVRRQEGLPDEVQVLLCHFLRRRTQHHVKIEHAARSSEIDGRRRRLQLIFCRKKNCPWWLDSSFLLKAQRNKSDFKLAYFYPLRCCCRAELRARCRRPQSSRNEGAFHTNWLLSAKIKYFGFQRFLFC